MIMKTRKPNLIQGALAALGLLGALTAGAQPVIPNPSFEADTFTVFPGYVSGNAPITGWASGDPARSGINPGGGSPFADNGVIPNGSQVAFIQNGASSSLSATVSGLTVGTAYKVNFRVNARGGNTANLRVAIDGTDIINTSVTSVGGANAYKYFAFDFTATAESQTLALHNNAGGDNTVVVDDFSIAPKNSGWSYAAWTDEANSGIDNTKTYTHAYNFGSAAGATINGVNFTGVAGGNPSEVNKFSASGLANIFNNDGNNLNDGTRAMANDFLYGGPSQSITITGLELGAEYVATIYSVGWENGTRAATFSVGEDRLTINQDHFGDNNGIAFSYRYIATDVSVTLNFNQLEGNSIHVYGFANYELNPPSVPQIVNPSFEADTFATFPGYVSGNGPITGWSALGGHGVNPGTFGGPFTDNGTIPDGTKAAFLQEDGPMSQVVSGFIVGSTYQLTFFENARNGGVPACEVKVAGNTVVPAHNVSPVGGANPYRQVVSAPFTATASSMEIAFIKSNPQGGDTTLLIDNVGFLASGTVPTITVQPQGQTVGAGSTVTLTVAAVGSAPLSYQWRKNGADVDGAWEPTLTFSPITKDDAGTYTVLVSNPAGDTLSQEAVIVVRDLIPTAFNTGVDDSGNALPDGTVDAHYKLILNPDSASSDTFVEDSTLFPIVTGPWVANNAFSKWIGPRTETSAAAGVEGSGGDYIYRTVVDLTGFDPASVVIIGDWSTDNDGGDILINGISTGQRNTAQFAAFTPFSISSGFRAGLNTIDFRVNNSAVGYTGLRVDRIRALGTALPDGTAPFIVEQPQNQSLLLGDRVTFSVRANGSPALEYQWYYGADPLLLENGPELSFTFDFPDQVGLYSVEIISPFGTVRSAAAELSLRDRPLITSQPQSLAVAVGEAANFSVSANGAEPLSYQWFKNGTEIPGATNPQLSIAAAAAGDSGTYSVRVSNASGFVTSDDVTLAVLEAVPGVFNTGVDDSGNASTDGTADLHYRLTTNPDSASADALVQDSTLFPIVAGPWIANEANSKWIGPRTETSAAATGDYIYTLSINLSGFDPATVRLSGEWSTDNEGQDVLLNGVSTGFKNLGGFVAYSTFNITSGFRDGVNELQFKVNNAGAGYTGLKVRNIRALGTRKASQPPVVVINSPVDGSTLPACATATICATATADNGATIAQVAFFANGAAPLGVATAEPFCVSVPNAPAGSYALTAIATDSNGNSSTSAPVNVTVADTAPPVVTCPGDITATATSANGAVVTFEATASDTCGEVTLACVPASGSTFAIGVTTVVCTATDAAGNSASCSFGVTVRGDNQAPTAVITADQLVDFSPDFENPVLISCNWWNSCLKLDGSLSSDPENGALTYHWFIEGDVVPFSSSVVTTNCLELGTYTVALVVTDPAGLSDTKTKTLEVVTAPLAIELLIEKVNQSAAYRRAKRELTATLRVALRHSGDGKLRPTQTTLDAFEKKVRAQVTPYQPELAASLIRWSQAISSGMENCIKPPTKPRYDNKGKDDDKEDEEQLPNN
jgi:hypothetical protein